MQRDSCIGHTAIFHFNDVWFCARAFYYLNRMEVSARCKITLATHGNGNMTNGFMYKIAFELNQIWILSDKKCKSYIGNGVLYVYLFPFSLEQTFKLLSVFYFLKLNLILQNFVVYVCDCFFLIIFTPITTIYKRIVFIHSFTLTQIHLHIRTCSLHTYIQKLLFFFFLLICKCSFSLNRLFNTD